MTAGLCVGRTNNCCSDWVSYPLDRSSGPGVDL